MKLRHYLILGLRALSLCAALALGFSRDAAAQGFSSSGAASSAECPAGNLLAGLRPTARDVRGNTELVTDGAVAPEGAQWDSAPAVVLETAATILTYDLGKVVPVVAAYLQADANDTYTVWGSPDGKEYKPLGRFDTVEGHGLRGRKLSLGGVPIRFLRVGEGVGDNSYSIAEFSAYCQVPDPFPPKLRIADAPAANVPKTILTYWNDEASARWELVLALLGLAFLVWQRNLSRQGRAGAFKKLRTGLFAALGLLSAMTYFNFFYFHFPAFIHDWEWTHYYVGSKYFKELGYFRLYECLGTADAEEDPLLRRRVELRKMTNLRTNMLSASDEILKHPENCKQRFSPARWAAFKTDVRYWRGRQSAKRWDDLQTDHGYNGTPVWNIAGTVLSNLTPASNRQVYLLAALDPAYIAGMILVVWWAFGWRVLSVALLAFATNFPSRFYWTGGSFLRWDWIFYMVAGVCLMKKERFTLAGVSLCYAAMLRIFPGFLFIGPIFAAAYQFWKERKLDRRWLRFFGGAALCVAVLVPVSVVTSGGIAAYPEFIRNTAKHKETPLTNYMGLRTVAAWRPAEVGRRMKNDSLTDPWQPWKTARIKAFNQIKPLYAIAVLGFLALLALAVRSGEPWVAAALSSMFIAVGVELTCYYYAFIAATALLYAKREAVGRLVLLLTAFTQFAAWAPLPGMAKWIDEQYTLMSAATVVAFVLILWWFGPGRAQQPGLAVADGPAPADAEAEQNCTAQKKKRRRT